MVKKYLSKNFRELTLVTLILLLATVVRFYNLENIPILGHDEARDTGLLPEAFLRREIKDVFSYGIYGIPNMFFVLSSIPHLFFPRTVLAVKFFAALFGVFSVFLTYLLARKLFGRGVAIVSGVLLSFYHVHLQFSRSEFLNLFDSFWAPALVLCLFLALEKNWRFSLIFGLVAGLSLHFYQGIRAVVLVSVIYFGGYILLRERNNFFPKTFSAFLGFLVWFGPSLTILLSHPAEIFNTGNAGRLVIFGIGFKELLRIMPERILQSFGSIVYYPIDFHYRYGGPFFQFPMNLFFIIGILFTLSKFLKTKINFLFLWVASVIFFNSTILENINFTHRLLSLIPVLIILAGLGLYQTASILKRLKPVFIFLILGWWIFFNLKLYFLDSVWKNALHINTKVATTAGYYVKNFPLTTKIYFLSSSRMSWESVPSWEYLSENYSVSDLEERNFYSRIQMIRSERSDKVFIALPERENDLGLIKSIFINCKQQRIYFDGEFLFYGYECLS